MLVKIPEFKATGHPDDLVDFYKSLGWNPDTHYIDCRKVGINHMDDGLIIDKFLSSFPEEYRNSAGLFWVNNGPSPRGDEVPVGHILLEEGWILEDERT